LHGTALAAPAQYELTRHQWQAEDEYESKIYQYKSAAAVVTGNIGKTPQVAEPDGAANSREKKRGARRPGSVRVRAVTHRLLSN
jgi:hypothetical protein